MFVIYRTFKCASTVLLRLFFLQNGVKRTQLDPLGWCKHIYTLIQRNKSLPFMFFKDNCFIWLSYLVIRSVYFIYSSWYETVFMASKLEPMTPDNIFQASIRAQTLKFFFRLTWHAQAQIFIYWASWLSLYRANGVWLHVIWVIYLMNGM